jgi:hypothetical protein
MSANFCQRTKKMVKLSLDDAARESKIQIFGSKVIRLNKQDAFLYAHPVECCTLFEMFERFKRHC